MLLVVSVHALPVRAQDERRLFEQGMEAFKKGNFGSAEHLFRKTLDADSEEYRDRAWFHLARSMHARGDHKSALYEFNRFLNRSTNESLAVEARFWMGESRYHLGETHEAMEEYRRYVQKSPSGSHASRAHERMGDMYYDQKRGDEAIIEWDAAILKGADEERKRSLRYRKARALYESGRYEEALSLLPRPGTTGTGREDARMMMLAGLVYQKLGDDRNAVGAFQSIPVEMKDDEVLRETVFFEARSQLNLGNRAAAEGLLRGYLQYGGEARMYQEARCELGALLIAGDGSAEGVALLEGVRSSKARQETRVRASRMLGLFYLDREPARSVAYLEESLAGAAVEERSGLLLALGRAYALAGRHDDAIMKFTEIFRDTPLADERDDAGFFIGLAYLEKGDFESSIKAFETIRRDHPFSRHYSESRYYLALARSRNGDLAGAITILEEHLRESASAKKYEAALLLLRLLIAKDDFASAGRTVAVLMRDHPGEDGLNEALLEYAAALLAAGVASKKQIDTLAAQFADTEYGAELDYLVATDHYDRKRYGEALGHYNDYLATIYTAHRGGAILGKTRCLYQLGRYEEITAAPGEGALRGMDSKSLAEWRLLRARSLYRLERYRGSYEIFDASRLGDYRSDDLRIFLECALRIGDRPSAMKALALLENDRERYSESLYFMGRFYMERQDLGEAERHLKRVVDEFPGSSHEAHALIALGELRLRGGDPRGALALLAGIDVTRGEDIQIWKNALLIRCHFALGMPDEALALAEKTQQGLLRCPCGEPVMKLALDHYYRKKDLQQFRRYATFLARYKGNEELIEYLSGKVNFQAGNFPVAYRHFKELSAKGTRYRDEALYHAGLYELLVLGNAEAAVNTFSKLLEDNDDGNAFRVKALIEMALIHGEKGEETKARDCLMTVLRLTKKGNANTQAENLVERFGYKAP